MYKSTIAIVLISFIILISSLSFLSKNFILFAEGQQQQQSSIIGSSKNVTDLIKSNGKNSAITLENKTVNYFDNTNGYLVYPTSKTTISSSV